MLFMVLLFDVVAANVSVGVVPGFAAVRVNGAVAVVVSVIGSDVVVRGHEFVVALVNVVVAVVASVVLCCCCCYWSHCCC